MARKYLGPRLILRRRNGRLPTWSIRDGAREVATGFGEEQKEEADAILRKYARDKKKGLPLGWQPIAVEYQTAPPRECQIYFVSTEEAADYPIKIGLAYGDIDARIRSMQTASPYRLVLLASFRGTNHDETTVHRLFAKSRLQGEWFKRTAELMEVVERLRRELIDDSLDDMISRALPVPTQRPLS